MTTFRIGRVLGTTVQLWGKNLVPVVLITAPLHLPVILWTFSVTRQEMLVRELIAVAEHRPRRSRPETPDDLRVGTRPNEDADDSGGR